jgi:hypothetical protein
MGNKVAREAIENLQIAGCTLHGSDGTENILSSTLFTTSDVGLKGYAKRGGPGRGYEYVSRADGEVVFHADSSGRGKKALCYDRSGALVAFVKVKGIMEEDEQRIYRSEPAYPDQKASADLADDEEVGAEGKIKTPLYHFATIHVTRKMRKAEATYSVVTGNHDDGEPQYMKMYVAEKLGSAKLYVQIFMVSEQKEFGVPVGHSSVPVAKVMDGGMTLKGPKIDVQLTEGCDLAAVILVGQATTLTGNTAGAMSGTGVYE